MAEYDCSRRSFLVKATFGLAVFPLLAQFGGRAEAAALVPLPVDNPQAKALGYVQEAGQAKSPTYKSGSTCANCQFFTAATGACSLFAGFSVSSAAWCSAWAKKA